MPACKAILLDASNTLWYIKKSTAQIWHDLLPDLGVNHSLKEILAAEQREEEWLWSQWSAFEATGSPNSISAIRAFWEEYDTRILNHLNLSFDLDTLRSKIIPRFIDMVALYPETKDALKTLRNLNYRIAMISNGVNQEEHARQFGIAEYFDAIIGSLHVGYRKPMPEIYQMALTKLEVLPEQAVMVGDRLDHDVAGAENVGIKGIHLNRSAEPSPASVSITDLWGLVDFLQKNREVDR